MKAKRKNPAAIVKFILTNTILLFLASCNGSLHEKKEISLENNVQQITAFKAHVKHIIIIYQENWSFDGLYGRFPHANNLSNATNYKQKDSLGNLLTQQGYPKPYIDPDTKKPDSKFTAANTPMYPYRLDSLGIMVDSNTGDIVHRFYTEQLQINNGAMDRFVAWSNNPGLVQSYFDASNLPEGKLAQQYTMCDNFFHSAFGGSFLNHMWLVSAKTPHWSGNPPTEMLSHPADHSHPKVYDNALDPNGYAINTVYSKNLIPYYVNKESASLMSSLNDSTIADRLIDKKITWSWYSGGWDSRYDPIVSKANQFQYHHQPFAYYSRSNSSAYLKDEKEFYKKLHSDSLPQVCFIKPVGIYNEHPQYATVKAGQQHVADLIDSIKKSKYWSETLIIIAYDENGGRWDHVSPPTSVDTWGPGTRVPAILVSPWSKSDTLKNRIDHTQYETVSILKTIEVLFDLQPLSNRDRRAQPMLSSLEFDKRKD